MMSTTLARLNLILHEDCMFREEVLFSPRFLSIISCYQSVKHLLSTTFDMTITNELIDSEARSFLVTDIMLLAMTSVHGFL